MEKYEAAALKLREDSLHFLKIFPVETWELIISKLRNYPYDLENLSNSSLFFRNLLDSQKTTFLFEKVLAVVAPTVWSSEGLQGLPVKVILNCRTVCSQWKAALDKLIPQQFTCFTNDSNDNPMLYFAGSAFNSIVKNYETVDPFVDEDEPPRELGQDILQNFERTHPGIESKTGNPFIWGNLILIVKYASEEHNEYQEYLHQVQGMSSMLLKYGSYVDTLKLQIDRYPFFESMALLRQWFLATPNLRQLHIQIQCWGPLWGSGELNLEEYREDNPFPRMEYLETLWLEQLPVKVFNHLIRTNNHVSSLTIHRVTFGREVDYDFFSFPLPNLKKLEAIYDQDVGKFIEKLGSPHVQWPLESLELKLQDNRFFRCATLFEVIQDKFASTLVSLTFKIFGECVKDRDEIWTDCTFRRLDLPKLRKVEMLVFGMDKFVLDFMLPMKDNLREICVNFVLDSQDDRRCRRLKSNSDLGIFEKATISVFLWSGAKDKERLFGLSVMDSDQVFTVVD